MSSVKFTKKAGVDGSNMLNKMLTEVVCIQLLCATLTGPFSNVSVVVPVAAWLLLKSNPI